MTSYAEMLARLRESIATEATEIDAVDHRTDIDTEVDEINAARNRRSKRDASIFAKIDAADPPASPDEIAALIEFISTYVGDLEEVGLNERDRTRTIGWLRKASAGLESLVAFQ